MSWRNRLENIKFKITTGDKKEFFPLWKNGEKSKEFNISKYDFINVEGSFIDRKKPSANQYPLVFWFQGDDNIEQCNEFELSANDNRYWTVEHPFYGTIKGQPTNIKRVDADYNVTEVSVNFWESLTDDYPAEEISFKDEVQSKVNSVNEKSLNFLVENSTPKTADINNNLELISTSASKFEANKELFNEYNALVSKAQSSAFDLITDTRESMKDFQEIINFPATFSEDLKTKIESYNDVFEEFKKSINNVFSKYLFESNSASVIAGICLSAINGTDNDFVTRNDIESASSQINNLYQDYLQILDDNQVSIYELDNAWTPNIEIQLQLLDLVTYTSNSLFLLSFNARQEREFELLKDSNLIILTHRFLGLDSEDENIENFRRINNIKNKELYKIQKGRTIKYFV